MDDAEQFLPNYLRFIRGLVDTADLPLNVSRELLQESRVTQKLKRALTKRALDMLGKLAKDDQEKYAVFWKNFGAVMKEGPVEDYANRDAVLKLLRFASTKAGTPEENVSLADYVARMPEKQKHIYYLTAGNFETAVSSPYLETFRRKGVEVLLMTQRIDEWMMQGMTEFEGHGCHPRDRLRPQARRARRQRRGKEARGSRSRILRSRRTHQAGARRPRRRRARLLPPRRQPELPRGRRRQAPHAADAPHARGRRPAGPRGQSDPRDQPVPPAPQEGRGRKGPGGLREVVRS